MKTIAAVFRHWMLVALLLVTAGCVPTAPLSAPEPPPGWSISVIALPRVTYGDDGPDPFCESDIYDEVSWRLKRVLEQKGYRVVSAPMPDKENSNRPDPWAQAAGGDLLALLPPGADALLRVRVDRYLALDLCSGEPVRLLEMDGSAELFVPGSDRPIWIGQGKAADTSMSRSEDLPFRVSAELARQLLLRLPMARR